jgi:hypothetical protein
MRSRLLRRAAAAFLACCAMACSKGPPGRKLASGIARDLALSSGGEMVSFLTGVSHPTDPGLPEDLMLGDLYVAKVASGDAAQAGSAVPNLRSARAYDPSGTSLAFLARYRYRDGDGELRVSDGPGNVRTVADGVSTFAWAASGKMLAFVASGRPLHGHPAERGSPPGHRVAPEAASSCSTLRRAAPARP